MTHAGPTDPFPGSGTTAAACAGPGVPFVGYEIVEEYAETANESKGEKAMADTSTRSDMFIEIVAPKDAENIKVPFDTKVMYNDRGIGYEVERFVFVTGLHGYGWGVECSLPPENTVYNRPLDSMYLERPDSLKQLAEDLNRIHTEHEANGSPHRESACCYVGRLGATGMCDGCRLNRGDKRCLEAMMEDIIGRVNRLAGDSESKTSRNASAG
nr:MAG: putative AdoMet-dependent methyltransferase [Bacteriophage sp.]